MAISISSLEESLTDALDRLTNVENSGIPLGTPIPVVTNVLPQGYLWLEGGTYDPLVYVDFAAYMVAAGYASGALPDWRNRVPRGLGSLTDAIGSLQEDAMQNISGSLLNVIVDSTASPSGAFTYSSNGGANITAGGGARIYGNVSFESSRVTRTASETRVKAFIVRWAIKAYGAIVNEGSADLVAIEQSIQNGMIRKDQNQNAQSYSVPTKVNILKNTLQAWEQIGPLVSQSNVAAVTWTGLDYTMLRLRGLLGVVTHTASVGFQFSSDNGSTWRTAYTRTLRGVIGTTISVGSEPSNTYAYMNSVQGLSNSTWADFYADFTAVKDASIPTRHAGWIQFHGSDSGALISTYTNGQATTAYSVNAIRLITSLGNISTTNLLLEGVR